MKNYYDTPDLSASKGLTGYLLVITEAIECNFLSASRKNVFDPENFGISEDFDKLSFSFSTLNAEVLGIAVREGLLFAKVELLNRVKLGVAVVERLDKLEREEEEVERESESVEKEE